MEMEANQLEASANMPAMSNFRNTTMRPFDSELILSKIANNDHILRMYHEKNAECQQIQENLESISSTAERIRVMYETERDQAEKCAAANDLLQSKLTHIELELEDVRNELINSRIVSKQTIADLENQIEQKKTDYLGMCQEFLAQANILYENSLSTVQMSRRCSTIKDILSKNGITFESVKNKRKPASNRERIVKKAETCEKGVQCGQQTKTIVETCEKSTQYQQSKATRSTCTSAFIRLVETATNTDPFDWPNDFNRVDTILSEMAFTSAVSLSPIREADISMPPNHSSTQTDTKKYCTQGTITNLNNIRHRINYAKQLDENLPEVKSEEAPSPMRSISDLFCSSYPNSDPALLQIWNVLGELLFTIVRPGPSKAVIENKQTNGIQLMEKIHEIRSMITGNYSKYPLNEMIDAPKSVGIESNGCIDEQSRDSIESYNSDKVIISKIRNLDSCSPVLDDKRHSPDVDRYHFSPITLANKTQHLGNEERLPVISDRISSKAQTTYPPTMQRKIQDPNRFQPAALQKQPPTKPRKIPPSNRIRPVNLQTQMAAKTQHLTTTGSTQTHHNQITHLDDNAVDISIEPNFKIPCGKRKPSPGSDRAPNKHRKVAMVGHTASIFFFLIFIAELVLNLCLFVKFSD